MKKYIRMALRRLGYDVVPYKPALPKPAPTLLNGQPILDQDLYTPLFSPWRGGGEFRRYADLAAPRTLVSLDRCWVLYTLARQCLKLGGGVWECGVYKGGTARMLAQLIADHNLGPGTTLHLFDTFQGMPSTDPDKDWHAPGDFADTSAEAVSEFVGHPNLVELRPGLVPQTFAGLESAKVCFAHVDVDIYQSVLDCCEFIVPRLKVGGIVVFDDYGFPSCPGARSADPVRPTGAPNGTGGRVQILRVGTG